jgi:hypothetical protein
MLKQTILSIWRDELGQVSDVRESVQKRVTQIRAKLRRLDEAFLYESRVDRTTYEEHRDRLREELTLAELELSEALFLRASSVTARDFKPRLRACPPITSSRSKGHYSCRMRSMESKPHHLLDFQRVEPRIAG